MSLKKIAEMVNVSPSTVSRVLNNKSSTCASKEVKDKIFEAARLIGYRPNEYARNLRVSRDAANPQGAAVPQGTANPRDAANQHLHVSIILARIKTLEADPFFYELFRELEITLFKNNIVIDDVIYPKDTLPGADISKSDGVILLGRCSQTLFKQITAANKNAVAIWRNSMDFKVDEVVCDGAKAAELAMKHLISLGHRNIAYIGDCSYENRYVGYCQSLIDHGIPMNYEWIKQTDQTAESGRAAFYELLEHSLLNRSDGFSAVFCANDITAISVLEILHKERKKIKNKISVISIDNIEESQDTSPYLTTINIPRKEMAHMAVNLLVDRIHRNHSEIVRIEFPCRIVNRDSCFPL